MALFRRFASRFVAVLLLVLAGVAAAPALAQDRPTNITLDVYAEAPPMAGEVLDVALVFRPDPGWHGYWSNPGDAGVGLRADWTLPAGWQAGEPRFPVPEKLLISGLMNHVYKGQHVVIVPLAVPAGFDPATAPVIAGALEWLACTDRICVPEQGSFTLDLSDSRAFAPAGQFDSWRAQVPPAIDSAATFERLGQRLTIAIPLPAALDLGDPHVFVEQDRIGAGRRVEYAAEQTFYRDGDTLTASIPLVEFGQAEDAAALAQVSGILAFGGPGEGIRFSAAPGDVPLTGNRVAGAPMAETPLALLLGAALLGGLILNLMPCVFPILSLKALALARAGGGEREARVDGLAYTAGVVLACLALGGLMLALRAGGEQVGWAFQLQQPGVVVALLVLAAVLTANFAGVFELPGLPLRSGGKPASAFGTGLLAAFVATPCTGPFMAAALGAALLLPPVQALALFAALGLGLALPFLLLGFVPALRRMLPAPGAWMERFRRLMAIPMGLTALALVWLTARTGGQGFALIALVLVLGVVIALVVVGRLQRGGRMAWPAFGLIAVPFLVFAGFALPAAHEVRRADSADSLLQPRAFTAAALAEARGSGQPVFLWFTADWCLTCKVSENVAIEREATRDAFDQAGVIAMRGDWTQPDPEITRFLESRGVAGIPLYLWYPAGGGEPEQLPQVLGPDSLTRLAR